MLNFIEPKEIEIPVKGGKNKKYLLSLFPAIAGREIVCKYPSSGIPKLGDYQVNEETMIKLMKHVAVVLDDGSSICLDTRTLIDNHIPSWEALVRIEMEMLKYNCSFFQNGWISNFLADITQKAPVLISRTLTDLLQPLLEAVKQRSTN